MASPAKILIVATSTLKGDQRLHRIASSLTEAGLQVTLWGRRFDTADFDDYTGNGLPYSFERLPCHRQKGPLAYLEFWVALWQKLNQADVDIICAVDADTVIPVHHAALAKGIPWVFDAHEWMSEVPEVTHRPVIRTIWRLIEKLYIPKAYSAYTVSSTLAAIFSRQYGLPFRLVRNMPVLEAPDEASTSPFHTPYLIYAGVINEGRGIECLASLDGKLPMPVIFCGDGDLFEYYRQQSFTQLHFAGFKPPKELKQYIQHSYAGLLLLNPTSESYRLSLANKFFDYTAAGIPCIYPALPEYQALTKDYPVGIPCHYSLESIELAISQILDANEYEKHRLAAQEARRAWHWHQEVPQLLRAYQDILHF